MSIDQNREYYFLQQLVRAPNQVLSKFEGGKTKPNGLDLDAPAKKNVEARLVERGLISVEGKGATKRFTLTPAGSQYLKTLPPFPRPEPIDPRMKAFVLLNLLAAGEGHVTLKQVKGLLPPALGKSLGFSKDALTPLLDALTQERAVDRTAGDGATADDRTRFRLNQHGKQLLMQLEQHPLASFKLSGRAINAIIPHSAGGVSNLSASAAMQILTDDARINEAKELMRSISGQDLLPIYELRRRIRQKYGDHAASHEHFDARLKHLYGERLRLVPISDRSRATPEQLRDSIEGANELFFYLRDLR